MDASIAKKKIKSFPQSPGVYLFWIKKTWPIYIGKAKNLRVRIESYFSQNLAPKTARMVAEAKKISFIKVDSELEALLLEATLIKKYQPKYNSVSKDDKHPLYIVITNDEYPRVFSCRKLLANSYKLAYGPFPSSFLVRSVLRMLRKIFPYSDHKLGKKACFYSQIGECNPCPSEIEKMNNPLRGKNQRLKRELTRRYLWNIRMIKKILSGNIKIVFDELKKDMEKLSKEEKFEEATNVREHIKRLEYITQPIIPTEYFLENPNLFEDIRRQETRELRKLLTSYFPRLTSIRRIECYDVAHLAGVSPAASMVTFINGEADKNFYRHFRIMQKESQNDIESLREVIKRRIRHLGGWGKPDLIIVDGGCGQVLAFTSILYSNEVGKKIAVVGIAKRYETLIIPRLGSDPNQGRTLRYSKVRLKRGPTLNLVQRIRDEAHRFARRYHHKLIQKSLLK